MNAMSNLPNHLIMQIIREADGGKITHQAKLKNVLEEFHKHIDTYKADYCENQCPYIFNDDCDHDEIAHDSTFEIRSRPGGNAPDYNRLSWYDAGGYGFRGLWYCDSELLRPNPPHELDVDDCCWHDQLENGTCGQDAITWIYRTYNFNTEFL